MQVEAEHVLEIGHAVVPAETHLVAEERQQQRVGQRLRDDREVHAGHARAEREVAEHQRQQARHQHHHQRRVAEMVEAEPVDRQRMVVEEHHEVRQQRVAIDAARADFAHQVHAHRVAAEREERRVTERQDARVAPHQIDRQCEHRVAQIFAEQAHVAGRQMQRRAFRQHVRDAQQCRAAEHGDEAGGEPDIPLRLQRSAP